MKIPTKIAKTYVIPEENNIDCFLEYKDLAKVASNYNELSSFLSSDFCLDSILAKQFLEDYISYNNFQSSQNAEKLSRHMYGGGQIFDEKYQIFDGWVFCDPFVGNLCLLVEYSSNI